jgi:hypothetical protein
MKLLFPFTGDTICGSHWSSLGLIRGLKACRINLAVLIHQGNEKLESMVFSVLDEKPDIISFSSYKYLSTFNEMALTLNQKVKVKILNPIIIGGNVLRKDLSIIVNIGFIGNLEYYKRFDIFLEFCHNKF